ncbi:5519_t:CDS:1, partial [Rhizophagus irregularis]
MSNIKESDKVNNLQERIKNTQTLRILAIQQGEEKLEKLEEELRILPEKSETVTYFGWPELDETFNWTTFR